MSKGLEELKRLAYENACCRCQYYIDKKCTNNYECVWKTIEKELKALEIIKKHTLYCENVDCFVFVNITKEVNDLLKEVLL